MARFISHSIFDAEVVAVARWHLDSWEDERASPESVQTEKIQDFTCHTSQLGRHPHPADELV
jgi:hypothetical protein